MPRLIVNADDFGLTAGINRAVAELYDAGAITSATLMANGPAFDNAVAIARARPGLGVGCHIVLTDGTPISHRNSIPSLIGADGKNFRPSVWDFALATLRGKVDPNDIAREAAAQVQRIQRAGIDVTHIDTHKHVHLFPAIAAPLLYIAERARIGAVRNPFEEAWSRGIGRPGWLRPLEVRLLHRFRAGFEALPQLRSGAVNTTDGTIGISATGMLDQTTLSAMLEAMPDGVWELVTHPGYNDRDLDAVTTRLRATREIERAALLATFAKTSPNGLQPSPTELIHYGDLGSFGALRAVHQFVPNTGHEIIV